MSISSYSRINSIAASGPSAPPHRSQRVGLWSTKSSGWSLNLRLCGSCPGFAPPGREFSRFAFLSVEGGFDEVREVFSGCCKRRIRSINSSLLNCCKSLRSITPWIQTFSTLASGQIIQSRRSKKGGGQLLGESAHLGGAIQAYSTRPDSK